MYLENSVAASSFNFRCFSSCLEVSYLTHQKKIKDIFFFWVTDQNLPLELVELTSWMVLSSLPVQMLVHF